jgi:hypothetical protein
MGKVLNMKKYIEVSLGTVGIGCYATLEEMSELVEAGKKAVLAGWVDVNFYRENDHGSEVLELSGLRPMTPEEIELQDKADKKRQAEQLDRERRQFEELKKKFGGP